MTDRLQNPNKQDRNKHLLTIFGNETIQKIQQSKILVIGAGGIGCELLKNLVCTGFGHITILDLDTIDTSNLNRQFLFQKRHVKRPKAIVARETATSFNPSVVINSIQANVLDPEYDLKFFRSFDLVLNALDNLSARRHVNKICVSGNIPLIESGTAGYSGQVQPIINRSVECYDCQPKPVAKTFPVCTIRSTPSTPIHCIVWAKNYLFGQLFGPEDETEGAELDEALKNGESVKELESLRQESKEMKDIRIGLDKPESISKVFDKVFFKDINRLLLMDSMWINRKPPSPLSFEDLKHQIEQNGVSPEKDQQLSSASSSVLKDQQDLGLLDSFKLFCSSSNALGSRMNSDPEKTPLTWDKDDPDALDFVTAAANLRATVFGIPLKTKFAVKEMAGNIIPAIATTNSAVSALIVFQAIQILSSSTHNLQDPSTSIQSCRPWYAKSSDRIILSSPLDPPNPRCSICSVVYANVVVDPNSTLKSFLDESLKGRLGDELTVQEGDRLIVDPDFSDNLDKSLKELELVGDGKSVVVTDEDEDFVPVTFILESSQIAVAEEGKCESKMSVIESIEGLPTTIPKRVKEVEPESESEDGSDIELSTSIPLKRNEVESVDEEERNRLKKKRKVETAVENDDVVVVIN